MIKDKEGVIRFEKVEKVPCITELLKDCTISQIYSGKDNWCRCGCGGKYYEIKDNVFTPVIKRFLTKADKFFHDYPEKVELFTSKEHWINSPTTFSSCGTCICIYFKGNPKI